VVRPGYQAVTDGSIPIRELLSGAHGAWIPGRDDTGDDAGIDRLLEFLAGWLLRDTVKGLAGWLQVTKAVARCS